MRSIWVSLLFVAPVFTIWQLLWIEIEPLIIHGANNLVTWFYPAVEISIQPSNEKGWNFSADVLLQDSSNVSRLLTLTSRVQSLQNFSIALPIFWVLLTCLKAGAKKTAVRFVAGSATILVLILLLIGMDIVYQANIFLVGISEHSRLQASGVVTTFSPPAEGFVIIQAKVRYLLYILGMLPIPALLVYSMDTEAVRRFIANESA